MAASYNIYSNTTMPSRLKNAQLTQSFYFSFFNVFFSHPFLPIFSPALFFIILLGFFIPSIAVLFISEKSQQIYFPIFSKVKWIGS